MAIAIASSIFRVTKFFRCRLFPALFVCATSCFATNCFATLLLAEEPPLAEDPEFPAQDIEFFEKNIRPVLVEHCYECHAGDENDGGLAIDSRAGLRRGGDTGPALIAGRPQESLLIEAIGYENRDLQMPPGGKLPDAAIANLTAWIRSGAADPRVARFRPRG